MLDSINHWIQKIDRRNKFTTDAHIRQSLIIVTLGNTDTRKGVNPVEFSSSVMPSTLASLVVSANNATGEQAIVDLPVNTASIDQIIFYSSNIDEVILTFDINGTENNLIGRATALISSFQTSYQSLTDSVTVPILSRNSLEVIGRLVFEFLVINPFEHENLTVGSNYNCWFTTKVIGHRGSGMDRADPPEKENTINSFKKAAEDGAEYVEFDVQLTKDHIPVIYHDWTITETGYDIPIRSITLEKFLNLNEQFTTLEKTFNEVPIHIGFNVEVKYPMIIEAEKYHLPAYHTELNLFVDKILQCVYDNAKERKIIFSTFHPDTCLMLAFKQPNYPVFFLTDCGEYVMADARCDSLQQAIKFAKFANLLGIVTVSTPIIKAPTLVKTVKESGLLHFTYGAENNDVTKAQLQRSAGVDAVIVDSVPDIIRGLQND